MLDAPLHAAQKPDVFSPPAQVLNIPARPNSELQDASVEMGGRVFNIKLPRTPLVADSSHKVVLLAAAQGGTVAVGSDKTSSFSPSQALAFLRLTSTNVGAMRATLLTQSCSEKGTEAVKTAQEFLDDSASEVRIASLEVFAKNAELVKKDEALVSRILTKVWDEDAKVFYYAGPTLVAVVGEKHAAELLKAIIANPPFQNAKFRSLVSIGECGKEGLAELKACLNNAQPSYWALRGVELTCLDGFELRNEVLAFCSGPDSALKKEALTALTRISSPHPVNAFGEKKSRRIDSKQRAEVCSWLTTIAANPSIDPLARKVCTENLELWRNVELSSR